MYNACEIDMIAILCFKIRRFLEKFVRLLIPLKKADEPACQRPSPPSV